MEVFAIGEVEDGEVSAVTITCRGQVDRVTALLDRPRAGQPVVDQQGILQWADARVFRPDSRRDPGFGVVCRSVVAGTARAS